MAGRTGESRRPYVAICLKTKQLQSNWADSYGDQGYLGAQRRLRKEENVFTQGTSLSHSREVGRMAISKVALNNRKGSVA
jgi:hypothetical protein